MTMRSCNEDSGLTRGQRGDGRLDEVATGWRLDGPCDRCHRLSVHAPRPPHPIIGGLLFVVIRIGGIAVEDLDVGLLAFDQPAYPIVSFDHEELVRSVEPASMTEPPSFRVGNSSTRLNRYHGPPVPRNGQTNGSCPSRR